MKSAAKTRADSKPMKEGQGKQIVLFCCTLFFLFLLSTQLLSRPSRLESNFYLFQTSSGCLAISRDNALIRPKEKPVPANLSPFYFQAIPINSCDENLLTTVSGIGPSLAERIVLVRENIGNFQNMHDLLLVPGIGEKRMLQFARSFSFSVKGDLGK